MSKGKSITATTCMIRNRQLEHAMPTDLVRSELSNIKKADAAVAAMRKELCDCGEVGGEAWTELSSWLLKSNEAKLAASVKSALAMKPADRPSLEEILSCAAELDLTQPIPEDVQVYPKPKASGIGFRPIAKFGHKHRAAQAMVELVLSAALNPQSFQYRGVVDAAARIRELVSGGRLHFVRLDIEKFYRSFDLEELLVVLPLPAWAVKHVVAGKFLQWKERKVQAHYGGADWAASPYSHEYTHTDLIKEALLGIPQGSTISPLVSMFTRAHLEVSAKTATGLINYEDDFLLLATSAKAVAAQEVELRKSVEALSGGHFSLKTKESGHLKEGCEFLGRSIHLIDGELRVTPTEANYTKLSDKMSGFEIGCAVFMTMEPNKAEVLQAAKEAMSYLKGWAAAFKDCDDLEVEYVAPFRDVIIEMLDKVKATPQERDEVMATAPSDVSQHLYT